MMRRFGFVRCASTAPPPEQLTPREAVNILNRYVVGQEDAKRAMAVDGFSGSKLFWGRRLSRRASPPMPKAC